MEQKEVIDFITSVIAKRKTKWNSSQFLSLKKDSKEYKDADYPDYHPTYKLAIELAEANRYHAEKGVFPSRLFTAKSPYQTDDELSYVRNNYKQVTLPIAVDFIKTISRAFNEGNYSITYAEDTPQYKEKTLQDYLETGIYTYGSLENFVKFLLPTIKTIDANGVIVVKPYLPVMVNADNETVIDSSELNEPQPYFYDCSKVIAYKEEEFCLVETTGYNSYNSKNLPTVYTYELYDTENIWVIQYDSKANEKTAVKVDLYYNHAWGILPAIKIKGIPRIIDSEVVWQSEFSFATDILDLIAIDNSTLNIAKQKCAYPVRVYEGKKCQFQYECKDEAHTISTCDNGKVFDTVLEKYINCPSCQGIGLTDRFSPLHDFIVEPNSKLDDTTSGTKVPFQYVSPSSEILKFLEDSIAKNEERARKILHIQNSNSVIKGTENLTATGMTLGDKSTSAFIKPISDQMFDIWQFLIDAIGWMRYKEAYTPPVISKPKSFDFNTEYDYIQEISEASKAGLPPVMIHAIIVRYLKSHFFTEDRIAKAFNLVIAADRLIGLSADDITIGMGKGAIATWEKIIHDSALTLISDLEATNAKFLEQPIEKQVEDLKTKAKEIQDANKPVTNTQNVISSVLNGA